MSDMIPVMDPVLPDQPDTWRAMTDEQLRIATEHDDNGLLTPRALRARRDAMLDRWYLIRNVHGWKSRNGRVDRYFTVAGIEKPYHGVWGIYAAFENLTQDSEFAHTMTLEAHVIGMIEPITIQQARALYDRIRARVGPAANIGPRPGDHNYAERG